MTSIDPSTWLAIMNLQDEPRKRFLVFDSDVTDVEFAYRDYLAARDRLRTRLEQGHGIPSTAEVIHYAKSFVVAVRRVGRLAQDLASHRGSYGVEAGARIKLAWQKRRSLLESYQEPRNAIEHLEGELSAATSWVLTSLDNDTLLVTGHPDQRAGISATTLEAIRSLRADIVAALTQLDDAYQALAAHEARPVWSPG